MVLLFAFFFLNEQAIIADHQNFSPEEALEFIRKMKVRQLEFETCFRQKLNSSRVDSVAGRVVVM